jgi:branched-subunit amino acid transport protein
MTPLLMFAIAGVGIYAIRLSGVTLLGGDRQLPDAATKALRLVAPAAVTAVVASAVMLDHGDIRAFSAWHLAAVAAIALAAWKRNIALTIGAGGLGFAVLLFVGL